MKFSYLLKIKIKKYENVKSKNSHELGNKSPPIAMGDVLIFDKIYMGTTKENLYKGKMEVRKIKLETT
jgi:hypothetical protein